MNLTAGERIDVINIGLMLVSCAIAMVIPFELFLFSYAILGPLHYLTEISWLHDKKYYTKGKYDAVVLIIVGLLVTVFNFSKYLDLEFPQNFAVSLTYIAFLASIIFVFVKNNFIRIAGLLLIILTSQLSQHFWLFFLVFLPTLIHVYIFTGLFMLYGAIKSKSRMGVLSVGVLVLCPVLLYTIFPNTTFFGPSGYGISAYDMFRPVNRFSLTSFMNIPEQPSQDKWDEIIFHSQAGILLMRFIAFAYTYHYLNWFSKTRVIQWHKVPKARFAVVLVIWLISISLYIYNYSVGLQWLFFLSFLHVVLEFPLNYISVAGIGGYLRNRFLRPNHTPITAGKK
jgi:hypothetical protein